MRLTLAALFCVSTLAVGSGAYAQETTLRFSNFAGPTSFLTTGIFEPMIENIEEDANGSLKIQMFSGGTLVKPEDAFDAVRRGLVDMAWSLTGYNPGRFEAANITEIPFQAGNVLEGSSGVWSLYENGLMDGFDDVYVFGLGSSAVGLLHANKKIEALEDLEGERIRAAGPLASAALSALDFTPVGIPASQVAENLSKRIVAGSVNDWVAMGTWQIEDFVNYHIDVPFGAATAYFIINKKKFDSLPDEAKAALEKNGGQQFVEFWSTRLEAENQRAKEKILSNPEHVLIEPTEEQIQGYQDAVQKVVDEWVAEFPEGEQVWRVYREAIEDVRNING